MPEVRRGSLQVVQSDSALSGSTGSEDAGAKGGRDHEEANLRARTAGDINLASHARPEVIQSNHRSADQVPLDINTSHNRQHHHDDQPVTDTRRSLSYALRPLEDAYYDSRAATRAEWKRRAHTLEEYYDDNPHLLPQLPFTWHHGWRRWRLFLFAFLVFVDGSALPIALYYGMTYAGHVEGWIIFAVVTTIWGGPTYLEFAVRTFRLIKKERFYRPLGTTGRWCFDMLTWASVLTITAVTALFVVGSAPHIVMLRVLCMPGPAILYCLGGVLATITLFHQMDWPAPFRISSTAKGEKVRLTKPLFLSVYLFKSRVANRSGIGSTRRVLFHRGRRGRQRRRGAALPRGPRGAVQGQPAVPADAVRAVALLGHTGGGAGGGADGGGGASRGAGDGRVRCVLGGAVPVVRLVGGHFDLVVQAGYGAREGRVGGERRHGQGAGGGEGDGYRGVCSCRWRNGCMINAV